MKGTFQRDILITYKGDTSEIYAEMINLTYGKKKFIINIISFMFILKHIDQSLGFKNDLPQQ